MRSPPPHADPHRVGKIPTLCKMPSGRRRPKATRPMPMWRRRALARTVTAGCAAGGLDRDERHMYLHGNKTSNLS
jgi:hypothetical protein